MFIYIEKHREAILSKIASDRVVIIHGETGCGKSSKLPVALYYFIIPYDKNNAFVNVIHKRYSYMKTPYDGSNTAKYLSLSRGVSLQLICGGA